MKKLDSGPDQLQRICDALRRDTLEPALQEAKRIEEEARDTARRLLEETAARCQQQEEALKLALEKERQMHEQNLRQALQQSLALLRQEIAHTLFKRSLVRSLRQPMEDPAIMGRLLTTLIEAIQREGTQADLSVAIGKAIPVHALLDGLHPALLEILKEGSITTGLFSGGLTLTIKGEEVTLDMSDQAVRDLLARFLYKDFSRMLFG